MAHDSLHWPWRGSVWSPGAQRLRPCTVTSCQPHAATSCPVQPLASSGSQRPVHVLCFPSARTRITGTAAICPVSAGQTLRDPPCRCRLQHAARPNTCQGEMRQCPCHVHRSPLGGHIPASASLPPHIADAVAIACGGVRPGPAWRPVLDTLRPLRQRQRGPPCRPRQRRNAGERRCMSLAVAAALLLCRLLSLRLCNQ